MYTPRRSIRKAIFAALGLALFASAIPVFAQDAGPQDDPPDRVARLSYLRGDVSFQPAGEDDWVQANLNRPLGTGDKLFTDHDARAEMEVGAATLRLDAQSNFDILNLNDTVAQTELTQGMMNLHVRRVFEGQSYEVDTPTLAFVINQPGDYRVDIAPDGTSTMVTVFKGAGDVYGQNNASYSVNSGNSYRFHDAGLQDYEVLDIPRGDDFDTWADSRNERYDHSASRQYVSDEVIGSADLDEYGGWNDVPEYGHVWYPTQVAAGWAPYRDGHWAWVDPWGWTWVDNAAWGFAPSTTAAGSMRAIAGAGARARSRCVRSTRPRWSRSSAVSASGIGVSTGPVGWFPLGPHDVYVPWYHASHNYFTNVNVRNTTIINNTNITNVYNDYSRGRPLNNANYAYRTNAAAVTAVPRDSVRRCASGQRRARAGQRGQLRNANVATPRRHRADPRELRRRAMRNACDADGAGSQPQRHRAHGAAAAHGIGRHAHRRDPATTARSRSRRDSCIRSAGLPPLQALPRVRLRSPVTAAIRACRSSARTGKESRSRCRFVPRAPVRRLATGRRATDRPNVAGKPGTPPNDAHAARADRHDGTRPAARSHGDQRGQRDRTARAMRPAIRTRPACPRRASRRIPARRASARPTGETSTPRNNNTPNDEQHHDKTVQRSQRHRRQTNDHDRARRTPATVRRRTTPSRQCDRAPPPVRTCRRRAHHDGDRRRRRRTTESRTIEPNASRADVARSTRRTPSRSEHTPPPPQAQQVQHAAAVAGPARSAAGAVQHAPPPAERHAPPPRDTKKEDKDNKDKDDENGHR